MKRSSPLLLRYGVAVLATGAMLLIKLLLDPLLPEQSPFLLLSVGVVVAAWFGGLGPGVLATLLGALAADYLFLAPREAYSEPAQQALPLILFTLQGLVISSLTQALRSARQQAERHRESLRRSEERFRALVQNSSDIITVIDAEGTIRYVSPAVERVMGFSPEELVGRSAFEYVRPEALAEARELYARAWAQPGVHPPIEFDVPHKDGSWRRAEFLLNNLLDDPSVKGVVVNQRDVTERKETEERLRESEQLYRNVVEQAAEIVFLVDAETKRVIQANAALESSLGYTPEETRQLTLYDIVAHDKESIDRNTERIVQEGRRSIGERKYRRKDGSLMDVEVNAGAISYDSKEAMCVVAHDVTERKRAEAGLRRSLNALLALYETGQLLSSSLEREEIGSRLLQIIDRISGTVAAVISLRDEREGLRTWRTIGDEGVLASAREEPEARTARRAAFATEEQRSFELPSPDSERLVGSCLPMRVRDRVIGVLEVYGPRRLIESETIDTFASLANQSASALENARLYEELAERERELHDLLGKLLTSQEEERRRVAYDIHDGLAQTAAAAHQHLQAFARHHPPDPFLAQDELQLALELVQQTVREARQVIADLRPTVLDDFGLAAAVRLQVETLELEGWEVEYEVALGGERLPTEVETTLYRVAQEAITNARKHARASRARVVLERLGENVRLEVRDEGRGFWPDETADASGPGERIGLSGMRERVSLLGGTFEIHSEPGYGTSVTAEVSLPAIGEGADYATR
jgi:PAS domain S-box-containing protein